MLRSASGVIQDIVCNYARNGYFANRSGRIERMFGVGVERLFVRGGVYPHNDSKTKGCLHDRQNESSSDPIAE